MQNFSLSTAWENNKISASLSARKRVEKKRGAFPLPQAPALPSLSLFVQLRSLRYRLRVVSRAASTTAERGWTLLGRIDQRSKADYALNRPAHQTSPPFPAYEARGIPGIQHTVASFVRHRARTWQPGCLNQHGGRPAPKRALLHANGSRTRHQAGHSSFA